MNETYNHKVIINKELKSTRLDKVLTKKLNKYSRMQIKMLIKNGNVMLNDQQIFDPSYLVRENDKFEVSIVQSNKIQYLGEDIKLKIIYEDNDLLIINKQAGIVSHPAPGNETGTLVQALIHHISDYLYLNYLNYSFPLQFLLHPQELRKLNLDMHLHNQELMQ